MSTQPTIYSQDVMGLKCVTTDFLHALCSWCGVEFQPSRKDQVNCSRECNDAKHNELVAMQRKERAELRQRLLNVSFAHLNRDRFIGFDGKYEGPLNTPITLVVSIRKDRGYHPMPIDVHVKPVEPRFSQVTPEDVDWAQRQRAFEHTQAMPRRFDNFCVNCVDLVIDVRGKKVRATKGVYLPVDHHCARIRVYDLQGKLLEVKSL